MTARSAAAKKSSNTRQKGTTLDHPDQAIDTPLPDDEINEAAFRALQENYEGDPDEVDGHTDDEVK